MSILPAPGPRLRRVVQRRVRRAGHRERGPNHGALRVQERWQVNGVQNTMSDRSRGQRQRQEREWNEARQRLKERAANEASRRMAALKAAVLAPPKSEEEL